MDAVVKPAASLFVPTLKSPSTASPPKPPVERQVAQTIIDSTGLSKDAFKQLEDLQAKRAAARQAGLTAAVSLRNLHKMKGETYDPGYDGFVFSTADVETATRRQHRLLDAKRAENFGYGLERHEEWPLKLAA